MAARKNNKYLCSAVVSWILVLAAFATPSALSQNLRQQQQQRRRQLQSYVDPKTVETKQQQDAADDEFKYGVTGYDSYQKIKTAFPLDNTSQEQQLLSNLRYVTFGTSHTWGAGLVDREHQAYSYVLSPKVSNLAIRAQKYEYPSSCFETTIKENVYDVAIVESTQLMGKEDLLLLQKLRQRFPDLIIIYLRHWSAVSLAWKWNNSSSTLPKETLLSQWAPKYAPGLHHNNEDQSLLFLEKMKEFQQQHDSEGQWQIQGGFNDNRFVQEFPKLQDKFGSNTYLVDLFAGTNNYIELMERYATFTQNDYYHPSVVGHANYAKAIQHVVLRALKLNNYPADNPRVEPFETHDSCVNWFNPEMNLNSDDDLFTTKGFVKECFSENKCSYELVGEKEQKEQLAASLTVTNPATVAQNLAISFMATNPNHPSISYPRTEVWTSHNTNNVKIAEPASVTQYGTRNVHVTESLSLGQIPPGPVTIYFRPLTTNMNTQTNKPFRLVSYMITGDAIHLKTYQSYDGVHVFSL